MRKRIGSLNFANYVLINFIAILIVITILGGYLYSFFYDTAYSDFKLVNDQYISSIKSRHENELRVIDDIVTQMSLADDATRFFLEHQPSRSIRLKDYLKRYTTVSQFFDMILYQYHDDRFMYSQNTSIETEDFLERECILEKTSAKEFREQMMERSIALRIIPEQKLSGRFIKDYMGVHKKACFFMKTIPGTWDETLIFMVPESYYDDLLADVSAGGRNDFLYYDGQVVVFRGEVRIAEDELQRLFDDNHVEEFLESHDEFQEKVKVGKEVYLMTVCRGKSGFYYGSMQNMNVFHEKFQSDQWIVMFLILSCAVVATFITGFYANRMIKKVKRLSSLLDEEPSCDLSYIERGIQTLVVTKKASEEENRNFRKARFIRNFFRGYQGSRQELVNQARKVGLDVNREYYVVVLLRNYEVDNGDKVYSLILEMIGLEKDVEGYGIHLVNNNQNLFVLFGDDTEKLEENLNKLLEIEREYCPDYVVAISNYHHDFDEASKAYLEADTAFDYRYLVNNSEMIRFGNVVKDDYERLPLETYFQQLKYAINTGNRDSVDIAVQEICNKLESENVSLYAFRMVCNDILQVLIAGCKGDKLWLDKFYNAFTISQCTSIKEFRDLLYEASMMIIDSQSGKELENSDIVKTAVQYMQQNYQNPNLTMNALAEHLNISSVTLSIDFKNEMEIKPSEYLANLRIERAKELLRNTNMLVKEISNAIGYEDDGSFTRRFKKHTGMTPGQYREKYR